MSLRSTDSFGLDLLCVHGIYERNAYHHLKRKTEKFVAKRKIYKLQVTCCEYSKL